MIGTSIVWTQLLPPPQHCWAAYLDGIWNFKVLHQIGKQPHPLQTHLSVVLIQSQSKAPKEIPSVWEDRDSSLGSWEHLNFQLVTFFSLIRKITMGNIISQKALSTFSLSDHFQFCRVSFKKTSLFLWLRNMIHLYIWYRSLPWWLFIYMLIIVDNLVFYFRNYLIQKEFEALTSLPNRYVWSLKIVVTVLFSYKIVVHLFVHSGCELPIATVLS